MFVIRINTKKSLVSFNYFSFVSVPEIPVLSLQAFLL